MNNQPTPTQSTPARPAPARNSHHKCFFVSKAKRDANQANATYSTGPRTAEGKAISSRNSFKHGLFAKEVVALGEEAQELVALRQRLFEEHQPANATEEILVQEIADNYWRLQRARRMEANLLEQFTVETWNKMMSLILRATSSAERAMHKALNTLRQLQKERGFVPQRAEDIPMYTKFPETLRQFRCLTPEEEAAYDAMLEEQERQFEAYCAQAGIASNPKPEPTTKTQAA